MHHSVFKQARVQGLAKRAGLYLRAVGVVALLSLPSVWVLTHPFAWIAGLEAMALGTFVPMVVFGLVGSLTLIHKDDVTSALECALITLCFACLQG
jgi:hypothetical protein